MEQKFYRDTWAEINLDHIYDNVAALKKRLPGTVSLFAVVKANAYGHGDVQVARTALEAGATHLAVAFIDEALALRKKGIVAPILVLGASRPKDVYIAAEYDIALTVFQKGWVEQAEEYMKEAKKPLSVHVKIDTGMGRIGVRTKDELKELEQLITDSSQFEFEGVFTHFATADELDVAYYEKQLSSFRDMLGELKELPKLVHCSNSAASLRFPESYFTGVRMGISMYGLTPSLEIESQLPYFLKEAFSLKAKLTSVKRVEKGQKISYGGTYETLGQEWIGTLPIGYADGWIRKLQGQEVLVEGTRTPIIGRICMDQTMIKLTEATKIGTEVILVGKDGADMISVNEIAAKLETINYEVICMISSRVPRVYIRGGKVTEVVNRLL